MMIRGERHKQQRAGEEKTWWSRDEEREEKKSVSIQLDDGVLCMKGDLL